MAYSYEEHQVATDTRYQGYADSFHSCECREGYDQLALQAMVNDYGLPTILTWLGCLTFNGDAARPDETHAVSVLAKFFHEQRLAQRINQFPEF